MAGFKAQQSGRQEISGIAMVPSKSSSTVSQEKSALPQDVRSADIASDFRRSRHPASALLASDFDSFKQQQTIFLVLNLFVLAALLLIHTLFAAHWGHPSARLIAVLAVAFLAQVVELFWLLARSQPLSFSGMMLLTWSSIAANVLLALLLAYVTNREDTQYFILMVVPILVAAFRLALFPTIAVIAVVDLINFLWVWNYARHRIPLPVGEYFEAGTVSLIYAVVGVLVWLLVNQLHQNRARLSQSLVDLERAREQLLHEERLAAVGRLSSAIAHEIRNPVAAITSALSTAQRGGLDAPEREEMFEIAGKEAARLEKLTTDFLAYARPRQPQKAPASIKDTVAYVADVSRPRSGEKGVEICIQQCNDLVIEMDAGQIQQALVNLVMNAVEASSAGGRVELRAIADGDSSIRIDVEDAGAAIEPEAADRIFEPFFTTKPEGTGLGLAIARNIVRAHGGDLALSTNQQGLVCFSMILPYR